MSNPPLISIKLGGLRYEYSCFENASRESNCSRCHCFFGDSRCRGDGGSAGPGHQSMGSAAITDVTPVQWRGRDGGAGGAAGLATGPIMGGQLTAPRYYEPFRRILTITRRDTADPSDMAVLTERLIAFHAIGHSIRSAERLKVATATATIASSSRF